jgi:hypothetical protein
MEYFDKDGNLFKPSLKEIIEMALQDDSADADIWIVTEFNEESQSENIVCN